MITEGKMSKGGRGSPPKQKRPPDPHGQNNNTKKLLIEACEEALELLISGVDAVPAERVSSEWAKKRREVKRKLRKALQEAKEA